MSKKKGGAGGRLFVFLVVVGGVAAAWAWNQGAFDRSDTVAIEGAEVRRGTLEITVTERGNLTAKNSVSIKSEVEGRTTLLYLIDEGVHVEQGELLAELDTSALQDQRVAQEITVQSARAAATKAREALEIQRIENESLIANARQTVEFARLEIEKFLGAEIEGLTLAEFEEVVQLLEQSAPDDGAVSGAFTGGGRAQQLQEARDEILIRQEELKRAQDELEWSRQLAEKGFVERTKLEADELAYTRAGIVLEQAERAYFLLERYEHPKEWARLLGDLREAERQLRKAEKQAVAQLADFEAAKESSRVKLDLEEQKLADFIDQISKGRIVSPVSGMVVYGRTEGSRWGGGEPVQEGGEIRERQEIVSIPGEGGMVAEASIHESALKQVVAGLPVTVRVDALRGRELRGEVASVAVLPDKNSWWANPNLRLYKTEVVVEETEADMRPGMSCSIEIHVDTLEDTLFVPIQSVHASGGGTLCFVRTAQGIEQRAVRVGRNNEKWIQVLEGLEEGEVVLLAPPIDFQPEAAPEAPRSEGGGRPGGGGAGGMGGAAGGPAGTQGGRPTGAAGGAGGKPTGAGGTAAGRPSGAGGRPEGGRPAGGGGSGPGSGGR
jgi:HlyD family secretion protein